MLTLNILCQRPGYQGTSGLIIPLTIWNITRSLSEVKMSGRNSERSDQFREDLFTGWTRGLSPVEQRISIFSHIRDIPYAIVPEWLGTDDIIRMMITANRGWCGPKHQLLSWMFKRLGIEIRFTLIPFRWQDQKVGYPESMTRLLPLLPSSTHLCCTALLNGTWQLIDATWDPPLKNVGFPVNDPWEGISETTPAVIRLEPNAVSGSSSGSATHKERIKFVESLNDWLDEVRKEQV
nr:hypothetical protein [uncultured Methanospirillum sp.]